MTQKIMAVISPDMVPARHYFLQELTGTGTILVIRAVCILAALVAFVVYIISKKKAALNVGQITNLSAAEVKSAEKTPVVAEEVKEPGETPIVAEEVKEPEEIKEPEDADVHAQEEAEPTGKIRPLMEEKLPAEPKRLAKSKRHKSEKQGLVWLGVTMVIVTAVCCKRKKKHKKGIKKKK